MWFRFSSVRPVEGQLMDLGCPSRVKKPEDKNSREAGTQVSHIIDPDRGNAVRFRCFWNRPVSPGHGESSQCLMWRIFSSLERAYASSQILSYLAISS